VDSIKRVEILAAMRERAADLPEVDPAELGKLRTLQEIVDRMGSALSSPSASTSAAPAMSSPGTEAVTVDLQALMLEVVAEKTGYPPEMLELSMDLEGDLGVDSIKRVEILAAMRERAADLPEVDPAELGKLRTLQEIVDRMDRAESSSPTSEPEVGRTPPRSEGSLRYVLELEPAPRNGLALGGLLRAEPKRPVAVFDGNSGLASDFVHVLSQYGVPAVEVDLSGDLRAVAGGVFLGGVSHGGVSHGGVSHSVVGGLDLQRAEALTVQREAFLFAKALAPVLADGGFLVTVQDTGGDFAISGHPGAWLAGLPALAKTAAQEFPSASFRAVDIERAARSSSALAEALAEELMFGGTVAHSGTQGGIEIALPAAGGRQTLVSRPEPVAEGETRLSERSVVLASGGARGVTAHTLIALARAHRCRLVLLGRTALEAEPTGLEGATTDAELKRALAEQAVARGEKPDPKALGQATRRILAGREIRATVKAIDAAGGKARYLAVDVQDRAALERALTTVRAEWGPVTAIVHGAGVLEDRLIVDKTVEQFDRVFDTKVRGLASLLDATETDPVDTLLTFSSVAGRCGNRGQCDYAMANETLNRVTALAATRGIFARSLGWGPWDGGMVTPALRTHFLSLGVPLIGLEEGAKMLVDELRDQGPSTDLVLGGAPRAFAADAPAKDFRYSVAIHTKNFPAIDGHRVKGEPVLPVALVLELFARGIRAARPDLAFHAVTDVKVLRGVVLSHYEGAGDRLTVGLRQISNGDGVVFALELLDDEGNVRYRAQGQAVHPKKVPFGAAEIGPLADSRPWEGPVYDGVALFHGPAFQVIQKPPVVAAGGLEAELEGAALRGWTQAPSWETDPALVDGGLQLALLWTCHQAGGGALPTSVGSFRVFRRGLVDGAVRAVLEGVELLPERSVSHVAFLDPNGALVAELRGVEMHVLPGSRNPRVRA
ncbi:MAG: SDR family oxidoreductase, partial [Myxococcota bacterium]